MRELESAATAAKRATEEAQTWHGLAAMARRLDYRKISDETSAISATAVVQN